MPTPALHRRFSYPKPCWLIILSLAVTGILFVSERFQWFPFNEKKGWTVLIAMAVVGATILLMLLWFLVSLTLRFRFQFSVRSLLILTVATAIPCSWMAVEMRAAKRQTETIAAIEKIGGQVYRGEPSGLGWLPSLLGDDFDRSVIGVDLHGTEVTDAGVGDLKGWKRLIFLNLGETNVTDTTLATLNGLDRLQVLYLGETKSTDAGLENLKRLDQLQQLDLRYTRVTDVGLEHLMGLNHLEVLNLARTNVTDAGVRNLQQALPTCQILR